MVKKLLAALLLLLLSSPAMAAWSIDGGTVVDRYVDPLGEHSIIKIVVTVDGSAGSFTDADLIAAVKKHFRGYVYWFAIDPEGTLTAAPQLTLTDKYGIAQFVNTTDFEVTNTIKVVGTDYDGQYPHLSDGMTFSFNDVGDNLDSFTLYFDSVR